MNITEKRKAYKAAVEAAGIDTNKDYFALSFDEKAKVDAIRRYFKYRVNHPVRTKLQCFWYSLQLAK